MCLNYTHKQKIDVIYIDPPYNTGNKDFTYNDKFVDAEDAYRHSKWLNFMEKRLRLARNLLKDDGVIFISIDDTEQANLKLLCDEIFGENNFVDIVYVELSGTTGMKVKAVKEGRIVKNAEFILIYCLDINFLYKVKRCTLYDKLDGYDAHYSYILDPNTKSINPLIK